MKDSYGEEITLSDIVVGLLFFGPFLALSCFCVYVSRPDVILDLGTGKIIFVIVLFSSALMMLYAVSGD